MESFKLWLEEPRKDNVRSTEYRLESNGVKKVGDGSRSPAILNRKQKLAIKNCSVRPAHCQMQCSVSKRY